jgi:putative nucleotidyltransferase with HDIG domain
MNPRILFVDDEANVLSGLRRMLRGQRNVWDMHFANGGAEALEQFAIEPFDIVVSDMRMPGIDGAQLLSRVAADYPNTVRLVLSGQSEHERIFRAIGPAHQFLSKPCDEKVLVGTITRACKLRSQIQNDSLRKLISQIGTLPSIPEIYTRLVTELESEDASIESVGEIIERDLAMSLKVLQLVNSSFFGLPQHVSCPKHAVSLLGLNVIRPLSLTAAAFAQHGDPNIEGFVLSEAVDHGLAVATAARRIADLESTDPQLTDDAFIAGMLHDIGKLILATTLPDRYGEAWKLAHSQWIPLCEAEYQVFGTSHAEVGAYLLDLWGLPNPIIEAVALHHRPREAGSEQFTPLTAVYLANALSAKSDQPLDSSDLDAEYLQSINLSNRQDAWQAFIGRSGQMLDAG